MTKVDRLAQQYHRRLKYPKHHPKHARINRTISRILGGRLTQDTDDFNTRARREYDRFIKAKFSRKSRGDRHWWK